MSRKLKCECGECHICRMREYMRQRAESRKETAEPPQDTDTTQETEDKPKRKHTKIQFLEVVDNTGVGLEIDVSRTRGTITVVLSMPEKSIDIVKTTLKAIKPKDHYHGSTHTIMTE